MPSPTAGLFGGLAQGIFGRMREHEDEQRKLDLEDKKNALNSLSSLLENATPETRPVIYKQMADVMSLKGKHRGVWDMLTGGGRQDYHDQLASKLDGVFGNVVGPEAYEQLKSHPEAGYDGLPAAGGPAWASPTITQTADRTAGKIALEDPTLNKVKLLQATYGLRSANDSDKIWEKSAADLNRQSTITEQKNEGAIARMDHASALKADQEIKAIASAFAKMEDPTGVMGVKPEHVQKAAEMVAHKNGLRVEQLQVLINEENAKADFYKNGGSQGGGADKPITPYQQVQIDQGQQAKGAQTYGQWSAARAKAIATGNQLQQLHDSILQQAKAMGMEYDAANGTFSKGGKPAGLMANLFEDRIKEVRALAKAKQEAEEEMKGHHATLSTQFPTLYSPGKDAWWIEPSKETGGVAPAGAPRTTDATTRPGVNIADMQEVIGSATRPASAYKVNQLVSIGGQKYKVSSVTPPTEDRPYGSYILKAVR